MVTGLALVAQEHLLVQHQALHPMPYRRALVQKPLLSESLEKTQRLVTQLHR